METVEELNAFVSRLAKDADLQHLLDSAADLALVRHLDPALPQQHGADRDADIARTGFSFLRAALALRENDASQGTIKFAFNKAGKAFHSLVRTHDVDRAELGFWSVMGATAYHLAGYSATAYSLLSQRSANSNFAPAELVIRHLILRDIQSLKTESKKWLRDAAGDEFTVRQMTSDETDISELISKILTTTVYRAFAYFEFALCIGNQAHHRTAIKLLKSGLVIASRSRCVTLWWIIRVAYHLIDDLWTKSLHRILPTDDPSKSAKYPELRRLFLAQLYSRQTAELEVWPSQVEAAKRAADVSDDLIVSLPTSSGKTRIAEICALMTLSQKKRVLIVAPLRALSSQMEHSFRSTFGPLGFSVSSLYGGGNTSIGGNHPFRNHEIVVSTPEKLEFALKLDPSLIDDVWLIVFDEAHMVGPDRRGLRFELLIQRLLRRADADRRRIVCLSAILPDDETLEDFTAWIRNDEDGSPITSRWRPTRTKYATIIWREKAAVLALAQSGRTAAPIEFIKQVPAIPPRRKAFPKDNRELTLATAWKFARDDKRVMIYCPQRNMVDQYAREIISLVDHGFLRRYAPNRVNVDVARQIAVEWLGSDHAVVRCLDMGIAIHHAGLPKLFLQELQKVLHTGEFKIIVTSPTLAQGFNVAASVLIFPRLYRGRELLASSEFTNVIGRVGRAFVDTEGLAVHTIFDKEAWRADTWHGLIQSNSVRSLRSGLMQLLNVAMKRLSIAGRLGGEDPFEYLANARDAWRFPSGDTEESEEDILHRLDLAVLNLVSALDADVDTLGLAIDSALTGSLWSRQVDRYDTEVGSGHRELLVARARFIWSRTDSRARNAYFAMGIGLESGLAIDSQLEDLTQAHEEADLASGSGDLDSLRSALTLLARRLLAIIPFAPEKPLPDDWVYLLHLWLSGSPISDIRPGGISDIQDVFVGRLVWALESLGIYQNLHGRQLDHSGGAIACLETGLPRFDMAMLVKAGLASRQAAVFAMRDFDPCTLDYSALRNWLDLPQVRSLRHSQDWPSSTSSRLWQQFCDDIGQTGDAAWQCWEDTISLQECELLGSPSETEDYRVEFERESARACIYTPDYKIVARADITRERWITGLLSARFDARTGRFVVSGVGPL